MHSLLVCQAQSHTVTAERLSSYSAVRVSSHTAVRVSSHTAVRTACTLSSGVLPHVNLHEVSEESPQVHCKYWHIDRLCFDSITPCTSPYMALLHCKASRQFVKLKHVTGYIANHNWPQVQKHAYKPCHFHPTDMCHILCNSCWCHMLCYCRQCSFGARLSVWSSISSRRCPMPAKRKSWTSTWTSLSGRPSGTPPCWHSDLQASKPLPLTECFCEGS